ncbi:hypothetical protein [Piscinibacter terrae]|nr:hypothetical protein [Albitalea terrae]
MNILSLPYRPRPWLMVLVSIGFGGARWFFIDKALLPTRAAFDGRAA